MNRKLTHLNDQGEAHMVDVSDKQETLRTATASAIIACSSDVLKAIESGNVKKGDVYSVARIAGIQAAKKCADLIPLCHPLMLSKVEVKLTSHLNNREIHIEATCKLKGKTGVEMEALTACSVAALTVYDMCKAIDKGMVISNTQLIRKTGGKSGDWHATT